jgi:hypothetical protein
MYYKSELGKLRKTHSEIFIERQNQNFGGKEECVCGGFGVRKFHHHQ